MKAFQMDEKTVFTLSSPLFSSVKTLFLYILLTLSQAEAEPSARLLVPDPTAWTGQRLPFFIELRAEGSFTGAAAFDLPAIPDSVVVKTGNPVLSSETDDNRETFVQRHEFALFSQADGPLELPPVTARFSHRNGYSGPSFDAVASTSAETLSLHRPPGSKDLGFIVTTESLDITESWNPTPGPLETGTVPFASG